MIFLNHPSFLLPFQMPFYIQQTCGSKLFAKFFFFFTKFDFPAFGEPLANVQVTRIFGTNSIFYLNHAFMLLSSPLNDVARYTCCIWSISHASKLFMVDACASCRQFSNGSVIDAHFRVFLSFFFFSFFSPSKLNNDRLHDVKNEGSAD